MEPEPEALEGVTVAVNDASCTHEGCGERAAISILDLEGTDGPERFCLPHLHAFLGVAPIDEPAREPLRLTVQAVHKMGLPNYGSLEAGSFVSGLTAATTTEEIEALTAKAPIAIRMLGQRISTEVRAAAARQGWDNL